MRKGSHLWVIWEYGTGLERLAGTYCSVCSIPPMLVEFSLPFPVLTLLVATAHRPQRWQTPVWWWAGAHLTHPRTLAHTIPYLTMEVTISTVVCCVLGECLRVESADKLAYWRGRSSLIGSAFSPRFWLGYLMMLGPRCALLKDRSLDAHDFSFSSPSSSFLVSPTISFLSFISLGLEDQ